MYVQQVDSSPFSNLNSLFVQVRPEKKTWTSTKINHIYDRREALNCALTVAAATPVVVCARGYHGEVDGVVVRVDVGDAHLHLLAHL